MRRLQLVLPLLLIATAAAAQINDTYIIPAAANAPGGFNTTWATQFSLFNPQSYALRVSVTYVPTGGGQGVEKIVNVPANAVAFSDNILTDLFQRQGTGALLVATFPEDNPGVPDSVVARAFLVTTNTFNNARSGTYGQTIPGVWAGLQDYTKDGISAVAHGVRNLQSQGWRTNVGAVNLGRSSVRMRVTVYDINGQTVASNIPFNLPPLGHFQDALPVQVDRGSVEFFIDDPLANDANNAAVVFPYVSVIDNLSGDPQYQSPTLLATPNVLFKKGVLEPTAIGKKIDTNFARPIRYSAVALGEGELSTR
jgi:hypothetical protein